MMRRILTVNNRDLLREIHSIRSSVTERKYHSALNGYVTWILQFLENQEQIANDNLYYLSLDDSDIWSEIMKRSQMLTLNMRVLSAKYISPLVRSNKSDYLSLALLKWLHDRHPQSKDLSFAVSDGSFSIYRSKGIPLIYYLPTSSKKSLLHLALFFHEFGHYLFIFHEPEMINYITKMQDDLEELLVNPYHQNDAKHHTDIKKKKAIIEVWFDWMEELFCDMVGLTIGGAAFLHSFSMYLRMSGRDHFYLNDKELEASPHPVSRIRIKFLVERARKLGLHAAADMVEDEWKKVESLMGITPIYHGYYTPAYDPLINRTLDDMLEEASPISFADYLNPPDGKAIVLPNFIQLLNAAWDVQLKTPESYESWERNVFEITIQTGNAEMTSTTGSATATPWSSLILSSVKELASQMN